MTECPPCGAVPVPAQPREPPGLLATALRSHLERGVPGTTLENWQWMYATDIEEQVMRIGVSFPTVEIGADLAVVRDFVHTAEELGYTHLRILDHVLGADPQFHPEVPVFYYTHESVTHEPFTLMAYLAALTTRIELTTAIIILPQRQTALVAKQAAEVDVLSGGRLRLGIGVGWNPVEYEALGEDFQTRGRRSEEQIEVLRLLWTQEVVTYSGRWHHDLARRAQSAARTASHSHLDWLGGAPDAACHRKPACAALRVWLTGGFLSLICMTRAKRSLPAYGSTRRKPVATLAPWVWKAA